jgi:1-deoxy-D-xylulose-5-phosphate synthase
VGASFLQELTAAEVRTPVRIHGIPQEFLDHAKRAAILERVGLSAQALALDIVHGITAVSAAEERDLLDVDGPR